ncbi:MAG: DUF456 domain-containing protein [Actinomycetales bacterium]|nr:DUF456 domain-containing protein [Actinomycetales bacterium]
MTGIEMLCALLMLVGLVGVVIQILPGFLLILGALVLWASESGEGRSWIIVAIGVLALAVAAVGKYLLAGRGLKKASVPNSTLLWGGVAGAVGFFVIPVVGLALFFVGGVFVAEYLRKRNKADAWRSTKAAIRATGVTILVELAGALIAIGAWVLAVIFW